MQVRSTYPHVRWLSAALVCAVAVAACSGTTIVSDQGSGDSGSRTFAPIVRGSVIETVAAAGTLRYAREAELAFGEAGTVQSVAAEVGQKVREGEALAALNPDALRGDLLEAEDALAAAIRRVDTVRTVDTALLLSEAREAVAQARVDFNAADAALERMRAPFNRINRIEAEERLASTQAALTEALAELAVLEDPSLSDEAAKARAEVAAARVDVEAGQAAVDAARAAVAAGEGPLAVIEAPNPARSFPDLEDPIASAEQEYRAVVRRVYGLTLETGSPLPPPPELRAGGLPPTTTLLGSAALPQDVTSFLHSRNIQWPPGGADETAGSAAAMALAEVEAAWRSVTSARAALSTARIEAGQTAAEEAFAAQRTAEEAAQRAMERALANAAEAAAALAEAQAALASKEADLAKATAPPSGEDVVLAAARAALAEARVGEALQALWALDRSPDPDQIALAEAKVTTASATLEAALRERDRVATKGVEEQTSEAEAGVDRAEVRLGIAKLRLERAVLTAPFDGIIAEVRTGPGAAVDARSPAIVLVDPTRLNVEASVGQAGVVKIAEGQRALVSLESTLEVVNGVVESIALLPVERGGETTYDVAVSLDEAIGGPASSISGLSVQVHVVVGEVRDALLAPRSAIYQEGGRTHVRMLDAAGVLRDRPVALGKGNVLWVQVVSGAAEGDRVLLAESVAGNPTLVQALAPSTIRGANLTQADGAR